MKPSSSSRLVMALIRAAFVTIAPRTLMAGLLVAVTALVEPALAAPGDVAPAFIANTGSVTATAMQPDGKIVIGGLFTSVAGIAHSNLARLNPDGTLDSAFNPNANELIYSVAVQADGKVLLAGGFTSVAGTARNYVARLNPDGSVAAFYAGWTDSGVNCLALQPDGKILAGGNFFGINGQIRPGLARLMNEPATQSLTVPGSTRVQWARGGASPEVEEVTFEFSTDAGASWSLPGSGTRITGGWERTGLSLPGSGSIRARGRSGNVASSIIESVAPWSSSGLEMWRYTHFGTFVAAGDAADNGAPDKDGAENRLEYAFSLNPTLADAAALPAWQHSGGDCVLTFTRPANVSGLTYIAEQSSTMAPGSWSAVPNSATPSFYSFHVAVTDGNRRYLRLRVTVP